MQGDLQGFWNLPGVGFRPIFNDSRRENRLSASHER